jgi:hypothetical protein
MTTVRPKRTFEEANLNAEYALHQLCKLVDPSVIAQVPHVAGWLAHREWWHGLTTDERKAILDKEWRYD